ncbi:MAG: ATP-binding protein [Desulfurococcus sp.]|jgi:uncharacterized protein (TIGR00269 family)|uniref:tRNA lysidine(34) synthetase n=1 Tax=Desulfurococcus sp. TaxID=51678 RepID=UPI0031689CD8
MAKCRRCGREAEYRVSYAKAWFCREHFIEYFEERVVEAIRKYRMIKPGDRVVVAVSGGKDSMSLLTVLVKQAGELGIREVIGLHLNLGIDGFSEHVESVVREYCERLGVKCHVIHLRDLLELSLPELASKTRRPPCSVCGLVKRYVFTVSAMTVNASVLVTGHHLDDVVKYALKNIYVGDYRSLTSLKPVSVEEGLPVKARPLISVGERDIETYAKLSGIPYVEAKCPFKHEGDAEKAVRVFISELEESNPGAKLTLLSSISKLIHEYIEPRGSRGLTRCSICGMPSSSEVCGFCRLTKRVHGKYMGVDVASKIKESLNAS